MSSSIRVDRIILDQANNISISNSGTTIVASAPIIIPTSGDITNDGTIKYDPLTDSFMVARDSTWLPISTTNLASSLYQTLTEANTKASQVISQRQQDAFVELVESPNITIDLEQGNYFHLNVKNSDTININVSYSSKYTEARLFIDYLFSNTENSKWQINTASFANSTLDLSYDYNAIIPRMEFRGLCFKRDGTKMFVTDIMSRKIIEYALSTPWQANTATAVGFYNYNNDIGSVRGVEFNDTGTKMYIAQQNGNDRIFEYAVATPWQVNTAVYQSTANLDVNVYTQSVQAIRFSNTGTKVFFSDASTTSKIFEYTLSTPWQINTGIYSANVTPTPYTDLRGLAFGANGQYMYIVAEDYDWIIQYSLSTPWQINTLSFMGITDTGLYNYNRSWGLSPIPLAFDLNQDGTKAYVTDYSRSSLVELNFERKPLNITPGANVKVSFLNWRNGGTSGYQYSVPTRITINIVNIKQGDEYYVEFDEGLTIWH